MGVFRMLAFVALVAGVSAIGGGAASARDGAFQVAAAGSCKSHHSTCAQRCRKDNPTDANCVSDHCDPKLSACRQSGCWQDGRRYGGQEFCGLK